MSQWIYSLMGVTADGTRLAVEARITRHDHLSRRTVDHLVIERYDQLEITGASWRKGRSVDSTRGPDVAGAGIVPTLREIIRPNGSLALADLRALADIAERWHLNGMNAACAHMTLPDDTSYYARKHLVCPLTGYRYGNDWLVSPLPEDTWERVTAILAKSDRRIKL